MNKYKISYNETFFEGSISEIINTIKNDPSRKYYKFINNNPVLINNNLVCNCQFICHRINTLNELITIDKSFGVELDIRDDHESGELILAHDPFVTGEIFDLYLENYKHNTLILNVKSERVELKCLDLLEKYNITNYFFLDSSFPMIYLLNKKYKNNNIASRYSEYECFEFTENIKNMINWIWVDCFNKLPLDASIYDKIKTINKKICIVSPELQNQREKIHEYREQLYNNNIIPDAICCKIYNIYEWI